MQERTALDDQLTALSRIEQELDDQVTMIELGEAERDQKVVAEAEASSASLTAAGADGAAAALADLLAQLPIDPGHLFDAACAGSAGGR